MGTQLLPGDETPDMAEVMQREDAAPAIPVDVVGPVRVQPLPARVWRTRDLALAVDADPVRLLHEDPTRSRAIIRCFGGDIYVAPTWAECQAGAGRIGVLQPPLELHAYTEVWVRTVDVDATCAVHSEHWTL